MIEKKQVRKMLAAYEQKLKEEINAIEKELNKADNEAVECSNKLQNIWFSSTERAVLVAKYQVLCKTRDGIMDIRCDEALEEE